MATQGLIRIGMILACLLPSVVCFGIAGYLMANNIENGWGWLLLIGLLSLDVPKKLLKVPDECPTCKAYGQSQKPASAYYEEVA
jgi:hypothetical protein